MGWRSWNAFRRNVSQEKMNLIASMMADGSRGASLMELGYTSCGLDDGWQVRRLPRA